MLINNDNTYVIQKKLQNELKIIHNKTHAMNNLMANKDCCNRYTAC